MSQDRFQLRQLADELLSKSIFYERRRLIESRDWLP